MTKYTDQERARYWPVYPELLAQYNDGTHIRKNNYGSLEWLNKNDLVHRDEDKPARIGANGTLEWLKNGLRHRDGDKPAVIFADGTLFWYQNGDQHRFSGPAVIYDDGKLEWYINDEEITKEVNAWLNRKRWRGTPEQIFEFKLRFS